jgi:hypothetical protein
MSDPRASRRRDGFTPAGLRADEPGDTRPARPIAIEIATATVIITGVVSVLQSIEAYARLAQDGSDAAGLAAVSIAIGVLTVVIGLLLRTGRAWLIGVNLLAIAGFLELISGTPLGILFGVVDALVVVVLLALRPWFAWRPGDVSP